MMRSSISSCSASGIIWSTRRRSETRTSLNGTGYEAYREGVFQAPPRKGQVMIRKPVYLALFALLVGSGVAHAQKVKVQLAPNLANYNVQEVAILGMANTSNESDAEQMSVHLIRALNATGKYHFVTTEQFATDAKRTGVGTEFDRLRNTWLKKRVMEPEIVKKVLTAAKYDAVVGMEVSRWEKKTVDPLQEGTSDTSVGILVRMVAQDGTILWSASENKTVLSEPYLPNLRATTDGGEAVPTGSVPQPPDIKKVGMDMASEITATLPQIKKAVTPVAPAPHKETPSTPPPAANPPAAPDTSGAPK